MKKYIIKFLLFFYALVWLLWFFDDMPIDLWIMLIPIGILVISLLVAFVGFILIGSQKDMDG